MSDKKPNILFVMSDQQRWDSINGRSGASSPNLDRLASQGVTFTRSYTPTSLCCPARTILASGAWPYHNGTFSQIHNPQRLHHDMKPGTVCYFKRLRDAGYHCGFVGKFHAGMKYLPGYYGCHDDYSSERRRSTDYELGLPEGPPFPPGAELSHAQRRADERDLDAEVVARWPGGINHRLADARDQDPAQTHLAKEFNLTIELLKDYAAGKRGVGNKPWFLYFSFNPPHDCYSPCRSFADKYDPQQVPLPANYHDSFDGKPDLYRKERRLWQNLTEDDVKLAIARYWAYCEEIDWNVGRLLKALDETGQAEDTLVIYTTDHADLVGEHGLFIKGWFPYEGSYRIPMVVRWPGVIPQGSTCDHLVQLHDWSHTLCEIAGADPMPYPDGRSLLPVLNDPAAPDWDDTILCMFNGAEYLYTQRMIITKRWKYVFNGFSIDEMYDLENDPGELKNLAEADDPEIAEVRSDLIRRLWDLLEKNDDPFAKRHYGLFRYLPWPE